MKLTLGTVCLLAILAWSVLLLLAPQSGPLSPYAEANRALGPPRAGETRVVFMGDSITQLWGGHRPAGCGKDGDFFPSKSYLNRGISGQTTVQMLRRFREDVVALRPSVVVLLGGINDIAENGGKMTLEDSKDNISAMCAMARANGIRVVLCSLLPANQFSWRPDLHPAAKVLALNAWMEHYCQLHSFVYVDYYSHMVDGKGGLRPELEETPGSVHTNLAGYEIMTPLVEAGIAEVLKHDP
jgi:lysophospholipase L1-like esterase